MFHKDEAMELGAKTRLTFKEIADNDLETIQTNIK